MKSYNRRKLMKRIIFVTLILLVVLIAAIVACALISYHKQPELTADEIKQLDEQAYGKREQVPSVHALSRIMMRHLRRE